METTITKTDNGYKATSVHSLGRIPATENDKEGERLLKITTSKKYFTKGVIESSATVCTVRDSGHGYKSETHAYGMGVAGCGDYAKTIARKPCARITEKEIIKAHENALKLFPLVLEQATAHYEINKGE